MKKFLIVRLSSLGDIVHTLPLVHKLKTYFPNSQVDWLVGKGCYELLSYISEIHNVFLPTLKDLLVIRNSLYDYVIDVQGLFKSAFLCRLARGKKIIGFKLSREFSHLFYDERVDLGDLFNTRRHVVDLNLELLNKIANNQSYKVKFLIPRVERPDNKNLVNIDNNSIIVFPSTRWESKMWPSEYWFDFVSEISKSSKVYICASLKDLRQISDLISKLNKFKIPYISLIGKTNIKDLMYLIQNIKLVVGMDSFGLHLASAIKNDYESPEVIGIYGPTSPYRNGPYSGDPKDYLYLSDLECIGCRKRKCPLGHHKCMKDILPSMVLEKVYSKLDVQMSRIL